MSALLGPHTNTETETIHTVQGQALVGGRAFEMSFITFSSRFAAMIQTGILSAQFLYERVYHWRRFSNRLCVNSIFSLGEPNALCAST